MILNALAEYYQKCRELYPDEIAPLGFEVSELEFVLVIKQDGTLTGVVLRNILCVVAQRPSNKTGTKAPANLLYDSAKYMINYDGKDINKCDYTWHCEEIRRMLDELVGLFPNRGDFKALQQFYNKREYKKLKKYKEYKELVRSKSISFKVKGFENPVCAYSQELEVFLHHQVEKNPIGLCLVSGEKTNICKTFGSTPFGIADNGKIVSFNNKCYESHGKSQGENAPISVFSEYAYTSALKRLLNSEENQLTIFAKKNKNGKMVYMTDRKLLFWSSATTKEDIEHIEKPARRFLGIKKKNEDIDPDNVREVKDFFSVIKEKGTCGVYGKERYYFLEVVPTSKGRIAISFWNECSLSDFAEVVLKHYRAMEICANRVIKFDALNMVEAVSPFKLEGDNLSYDIVPNLIDAVFRSIFKGYKYPDMLFKMALSRIMSEQTCPDKTVNKKAYSTFVYRDAERAAICKAYLCRNFNLNLNKMINEQISNKGYLCGRLFAVLEYTQQKANWKEVRKWKSDLRSKYMNAAMTSPAMVFPSILANSNYYLKKLDGTTVDDIENLKQQIFSNFEGDMIFPPVLTVTEQGCFFFGYYQQQQELDQRSRKYNVDNEENGVPDER